MSILLLMDDEGPPFPRSLFAAGEQGIWLDPSDFSTLFQDSAGTTPVTALGQPVGLALDKRLGLALGAELVTNGGFDSDTAWAKGSGWSISGGKAVRVAAGGGSTINQSAALVAGAIYRIEFDYYGLTTTSVYASFRGGSTVSSPIISVSGASGRYSCVLRAVSGNNILDISCSDPATSGSFDNFTIRELLGNHAYQTTSASRPTLQQDSNGLYYLSFDGTDDGMKTPSIDFSLATDIEVFLGLVNNVTTHQKLVMLGTYSTQTGSFELSVGEVVSGALVIAKGNTASNFLIETGAKAAPRKSVVYSKVNKVVTSPGAGGVIRVNSMASASSPGGSGGGYSFANAAFYIGSASTGSLVLNGRIYQLIVRGAASNDGQIAAGEAWCNAKTRAY